MKWRSGDLLCFAALPHLRFLSDVPTPTPPPPPFALGACYYIFLLSENGFISPLLSPAPSLPFYQIVFCPLIAPPPLLLLHHLIPLVSIMQMVRLPAVIRLFGVLLSCRQQLSGKNGRKKNNKNTNNVTALGPNDILKISEQTGRRVTEPCPAETL